MITGVQVKPPRARPHGPPTPGDIALKLIGRDYLSYSSISTYQRCPLKFYFQYVLGLEPEFKSASLVFGGAIHKAIEHHYRKMFEGGAPPSVDDLVATYERAWRAEATRPVRFGKNESETTLRGLAHRMLTAFRASPVSKLDTTILGIEEELRAPVIPDCPDVLGRIDLIHLDEQYLTILDFKTSRSRWTPAKIEESTPQMVLYADLAGPIAQACNDRPIRLQWVVLTKTKSPAIETHSIDLDPRQLARTKLVFERVWQAIKNGAFYPSPSPMACSTCPFKKACQQWEG
ncbi:MAG: PD-(D/E)XK nuclease family protein [Planctomycetes bacterium]|nr:PD-(D/E)XK nuclease family protein [Planctomycetota bacterium]